MVKQDEIPFNRPFVVGKELFNIANAVIGGRLSGDGLYTKKCNVWLETMLGCKRAFLTPSCTAALEMAAILCDIKPGDEIIMPSFTFVSTANAFVLRGGIPVFIDIRPDTLNIDERLIHDAISDKTRAIVPVHYAGAACEMDEIMALAAHYGLWVIEDAAQALLSTYKGRQLGTIGHLGTLSFHETKNIISGEGGALLVNEPSFADRAEVVREKGTNRNKFFRGEIDKYTWVDIGSSFLPSEIVGAFLYAQLEMAEKIIEKRKRIYNKYVQTMSHLCNSGFVELPFISDNNDCNGHLFYLITRSLDERTRLMDFLKKRGIKAVFHYVPLHSSPAGKRYGKTHGSMDFTNALSDRVLRLPLYYEMNEHDVERIAEEVTNFYRLK